MKDLRSFIGQKYGRLTIIDYLGKSYFLCKCNCGNIKKIRKDHLINGDIKSCGCISKRYNNVKRQFHNGTGTRLYSIYRNIKRRCFSKNDKLYKYYGERGITMCKEWQDNFKLFKSWSINNGYTDDLTIDRINVNGNYEPNNCRWITMKEQCRNKRNNHNITYNGKTQCLNDWADEFNINRTTLLCRLKRGWNLKEALTTPKLLNPHARQNKNNSKSLEIDKTIKKY